MARDAGNKGHRHPDAVDEAGERLAAPVLHRRAGPGVPPLGGVHHREPGFPVDFSMRDQIEINGRIRQHAEWLIASGKAPGVRHTLRAGGRRMPS